ncbi:hypothetical protein GDO81_028874 [Engystomops pustulosus]|uniref:Taste receptor type 2 n=1 Tax=Engystomops pustulosus TaxID=76066 RepID=A0AAV6ZRJ5_ENGPU|nr:hypothetical protein GDO81_028874 [Engystomops pustulosus]
MEMFGHLLLLSVLYMECLVGFTVNMIILTTIFMKWKTQRSLPTCDKILSHLAISRGLFFVSVIMGNLIFQFSPWLLQNDVMISILIIQTGFVFNSNLWIASVLCVFYCVRIVTYNCALCVFLRSRISTLVPWLVTAALVMSLISSLPLGWFGFDYKTQNTLNDSTGNKTENEFVIVPNFDNWFLILILGSFPPFLIFCVANFLLINFLLIHTRRMRNVTSHNLRSHFGALKSMSLFLVLQIIFFIFMSFSALGKFPQSKIFITVYWLFICFPSLFHSFFLFFSSNDLRKIFVSKCLSCIKSVP